MLPCLLSWDENACWRIVEEMANGMTWIQKFDKFLTQSLDEIRGKVRWVERDGEDVRGWLVEHQFLEEAGEGRSDGRR